jgi:hypothetical protein
MSSTIEIPDTLFAAVRKKALVRKTTPENLVVEWLSERLDDDEETQTEWLTALKAEAEAFARLKPGLLPEYAGQYVAIYSGEVIGSGEDEFALLRYIHQRYGPIPCCIDRVDDLPLRRVRITSIWKARS